MPVEGLFESGSVHSTLLSTLPLSVLSKKSEKWLFNFFWFLTWSIDVQIEKSDRTCDRFFKKSLDRLGGPKNVVCGAFTKSVYMCTRFTCIRTWICIHMYSYVYHSCIRYYLDMKVLKVFKLPEKGTCLQKICFLRYGPKTSRLIRMEEF